MVNGFSELIADDIMSINGGSTLGKIAGGAIIIGGAALIGVSYAVNPVVGLELTSFAMANSLTIVEGVYLLCNY